MKYKSFIIKNQEITKHRVPGAAAVHTAGPSILQQTEITDNTE